MPAPPKAPRPRPRNKAKTDATENTENIGGIRGIRETLDDTPKDVPPRDRDSAPIGEGQGAAARPKAATRQPSVASLEARLSEFLGTAALPFALTGDDYCATIIAQRSPDLAKALVALSRENAAIKRVLNRMLEGSAWGGVALCVASIVIPIAQHHNLVPGDDPFRFQYPNAPQRPITSPPAGWDGWSDRSSETTGDTMTQTPGAPPGVVTVESTTAKHNGAT